MTQHTYPRKRRRIWPWIVVPLALAFCVVSAAWAIASNEPTQGPDTPHLDATEAAPAAKPASKKATGATITGGTWTVPDEVKPGTYTTTADGTCGWARLKSFDGDLDAIVANGYIKDGQRGRLVVKKTDKGLQLIGDCAWTRAA